MATRPRVSSVVVTLFFWVVFLVTAPVALVCGVLLFLPGLLFDRDHNWVHRFLCYWGFDYLRVGPRWRAHVHHRERIPPGPCVFVANHRSMADVMAAFGLNTRFKFVSKASLFKIPVAGWMMRMCRYVELERGDLKSTRRMWSECRGLLARGVSVLLFPEGTYSPDGKLLPFRRGAFSLALEQGVPIVPVVLRGTHDLVVEDGPWMSARADIHVSVLEPMLPETFGTDAQVVSSRVRARIEAALEQAPGEETA